MTPAVPGGFVLAQGRNMGPAVLWCMGGDGQGLLQQSQPSDRTNTDYVVLPNWFGFNTGQRSPSLKTKVVQHK